MTAETRNALLAAHRAITMALETLPAATSDAVEWVRVGNLEFTLLTLNNGESANYADAGKVCAAVGGRLPTRPELESILDLTRYDPAIDTEKFPDTKSGGYWTSTLCAWAPSFAWCVDFDDGSSGTDRRDGDAFVRAVRSVPAGQ